MSALSTYQSKLTFAVGTSEQNLLTSDKRNDAINEAIRNIVRMFPIPQYQISTTLAFVSGIAALPTDCLLPLELYDPTGQVRYDLIDIDKFRNNISQTYNIYYDTTLKAEQMQIYPNATINLTFDYLQFPALLASASDSSRLNTWWDFAVAQEAARILFASIQSPMLENQMKIAQEALGDAWQMERQRLEGFQDMRLQSIYERRQFITSGSNLRN